MSDVEPKAAESEVLAGAALPPGYGSVNPFVAIRGPGGAPAFIAFVEQVFRAQETLAAHTVDADELLIHAEGANRRLDRHALRRRTTLGVHSRPAAGVRQGRDDRSRPGENWRGCRGDRAD